MRKIDSIKGNGKKGKKEADPAFRFGGRHAALARGARPNARRLPTRNMTRGR
ncbi:MULTISPECIES: hypothetical protein [Thermomonospora]|uniref:Uncharacterized protein n=1 Tax=Thermomonospora curvata (strain ATCC 19995 / DSM 43183 / JCM 3096 / KCTC 9072 / NBRC 15933 / NCIMB 10081 / Henssen B9) TaxID=471852 RepID=D1A1B6_THECD|nr:MULTISPECIES: hypothetical protein [Thermomonospora]ACY95838.1 hypothetical protein Tcur_0233 [Thermomonospora curvata DSM 43183]